MEALESIGGFLGLCAVVILVLLGIYLAQKKGPPPE